MVRLLISR